jgi:hypothetical protein
MQTIRRVYLYTVAFLGLEVVLWGAIGVLRSILDGGPPLENPDFLAESLSLVLVGLPVFLLHLGVAQRLAYRDLTDRSARARAIFLFGALLATLLPALVNFLALLNRGLLSFIGADPSQAMLSRAQTDLDNLVAIAVNLLGAALPFLLLKTDGKNPLLGNGLIKTRRAYRLGWLVAGIAMVVSGFSLVLQFILGLIEGGERVPLTALGGGLSLLLAGLPLWLFVSRRVAASLVDPAEQRSLLRLVMAYSLAFAGLGALLLTAGLILRTLLQVLLGANSELFGLLEEVRRPLSIALPMGAVWIYYERQLRAERQEEIAPVRHSRLHRLYKAVFAFCGFVTAFAGLTILLDTGIAFLLARSSPAVQTPGESLASPLACLLVGSPLWLYFWRRLQAEAGDPGGAGDRARMSFARKAYLYGIFFLGVCGLMVSAGQLVFLLLQSPLGIREVNLQADPLPGLKNLFLYLLVLGYHGWVMRRDARRSERSLSKRRALFPVLVLVPDEGDFAERVVSALEHYLPGLPIAVHPASSGAPDESLSTAKAVILPFEVLAKPPEALRLWLQSFAGERLVVPSPVDRWEWVAGSRRNSWDPAQNAALAILDRVEGSETSGEEGQSKA